MSEKLQKMANALTEEAKTIRVDIAAPTALQKLLIKLKIIKSYKEFQLKPAVLGKLTQISKILLEIHVPAGGVGVQPGLYQIAVDHGEKLAKVVAIAVSTEKHAPQNLIDFFYNNVTTQELAYITRLIIQGLDLGSFMYGIVSLKGTNILTEMNPEKPMGSIASGTSLQA